MDWIHLFSLFLFDFDGLLVNTEELHFKAYQQVCSERGFKLDWDFKTFCKHAHYESLGIKKVLNVEDWDAFYSAKRAAYLALITKGEVILMPGVEQLLTELAKSGKVCAVITNSPREQIETICADLPILKTIPHWFAREDYSRPKPDPDGYLTALRKLGGGEGRMIGFEDTFKGMQALRQTPVHPVVISPYFCPEEEGVTHFESFEAIPSNWEG